MYSNRQDHQLATSMNIAHAVLSFKAIFLTSFMSSGLFQLDSEKKKKATVGDKKDEKPEVKTVGKLLGAGTGDRPPASWR